MIREKKSVSENGMIRIMQLVADGEKSHQKRKVL